VGPDDLKLIKIVDTEEDVVEVLDAFYKKYNFKLILLPELFYNSSFCYFSFDKLFAKYPYMRLRL
jgi:hypothetical protein